MTTIILTIIGILLAAAAALMVIFYGGDAFNSGSTGAAANSIQNAGTNYISAYTLARIDTGSASLSFPGPSASERLDQFVALRGPSGSYMKELPSLPAGFSQGMNSTASYYVIGISGPICARINANLKNGVVAPGTSLTSKKMLCIPYSTDPNSQGEFWANP